MSQHPAILVVSCVQQAKEAKQDWDVAIDQSKCNLMSVRRKIVEGRRNARTAQVQQQQQECKERIDAFSEVI